VIYWTENGYTGPSISVPSGRLSQMNIIYNTLVPESVKTPEQPWNVGLVDYTETDPEKQRYKTVYYANNTLYAYNVEGRVFIEYLGSPKPDGTYEQKGVEVVQIVKNAIPKVRTVDLGEPLYYDPVEDGAGDEMELSPKVQVGLGVNGPAYIDQQVLSNGVDTSLFAVRETQADVVNSKKSLDNTVLVYWMETAQLGLLWPKQYVGYIQQWPDDVAKYSLYARPDASVDGGVELSQSTGVQLDSSNNPVLVYQDDPDSAQAVKTAGNLFYTLVTSATPTCRALLRYSKDGDVWFERVFSQLDPYVKSPTVVESDVDANGNVLLVEGQDYLLDAESGVVHFLTGSVPELARIAFSSNNIPFPEVRAMVDWKVGERIIPDLNDFGASPYEPSGGGDPVFVGYINQSAGNAFHPGAYKDPFAVGFDEAVTGAIIGVNALAGNDILEVWWYKKSEPGSSKITGVLWPTFVQRYHLQWPEDVGSIVLASNCGSGDLASAESRGAIYTQNEASLPGYNPNEEHALMLNGRAWALRDDLNTTEDSGATWTSSAPYVMIDYTEIDQRPAMRLFKVMREDAEHTFRYSAVAGRLLQSPMPLPLLPPPLMDDGSLASYEMPGVAENFSVGVDLESVDAYFAHYEKFTWTDRKGGKWLYRGPHQEDPNVEPTLNMRYFYTTLPGFAFPALAEQPAVGTITPYLRKGAPGAYEGDLIGRGDQPLDVVYVPRWPQGVPELRVGETLTLPKLGLPQIRGQESIEVVYQQSMALDNEPGKTMLERMKSVRLFDPTRAKIYRFAGASSPPEDSGHLEALPGSIHTSDYLGKTYFPSLPPHLSSRFYWDPAAGAYGGLVFKGKFMDELFGEKYLQLNVMTVADLVAVKGLVPDSADGKGDWDEAVSHLAVMVETYVEDPEKKGTFIVDTDEEWAWTDLSRVFFLEGVENLVPRTVKYRQPVETLQDTLVEVNHSDTAVDSYAVSGSGGGQGYVVMAMNNGRNINITNPDGPVSLAVFKVSAPLYRGQLKVIASSNPLDEKLTLQHTGDFAAHPEDFDFEWRYAPPADGMPLKLYSFERKLMVGGSNDSWKILNNPTHDVLSPENDYEHFRDPSADDQSLVSITPQQKIVINDGNGTSEHGVSLPHSLIRKTFSVDQAPLRLFVSLDLGDNDGADVYLNGAKVASLRSPVSTDSSTGAVPATAPAFSPLSKVFEIDSNALLVAHDGGGPIVNVLTVELYTSLDVGGVSRFNLRLEGSYEVENLSGWLPLTSGEDVVSSESTVDESASPVTTGIVAVQGKNRHTIQGSSILTLSDNFIIMRYRARDPQNAAYAENSGWSKWTEPQLAEGWIKRVLAGINPFQQRIKDLFNHENNTSVSLVEQAGKRWEGDIALNLENINDSGLLEIYETVLNRGKQLSIDGAPAINYGGANDALLLAAGYLSDLYMVLGNEAYADAANSTIAFSTDTEAQFVADYGSVATALFAFKGQLSTVLDEELALLRGRDDFLLPGTRTAPVYNRLVWNYTRGIDSGEAIYALNYNIKDRVWDTSLNANNPSDLPVDGVISAADAAISYPQGHGDAYGHYLTALTGYYHLLNNENFSWTPRIEAVLVLGTAVSVDYYDERKFASAAAALTRSAGEILDLTYRKQYSASKASEWSHLSDNQQNTNTGETRHWGTDDWASRGGQGAFFHWVTANSLLPAEDLDPGHTGIQKIDRTTVPELEEITENALHIQSTLDHADAHLNPLGLAEGALSFDISPAEIDEGKTHYEQIYERAILALQNAADAFDNAKGVTQFLRQQEDTLENQRNVIVAQEQSFTNRLVEIYGTPYFDDIGPGKTYKQGYEGPDLYHSMLVDLPEIFNTPNLNTGKTTKFELVVKASVDAEDRDDWDDAMLDLEEDGFAVVQYEVDPEGRFLKPDTWGGARMSPGQMQTAVSNEIAARSRLMNAMRVYEKEADKMDQKIKLYNEAVETRSHLVKAKKVNGLENATINATLAALDFVSAESIAVRQLVDDVTESIVESTPKVVGLANDVSFGVRMAAKYSKAIKNMLGQKVQLGISLSTIGIKAAQGSMNTAYDRDVSKTNWELEHAQLFAEIEMGLSDLLAGTYEVDVALRSYDQSKRDLQALRAKGDRIQKERLVFRQHAAALIQGYRTRDFAFRAFRDEALERYKGLFELAAKYTYLSARAYDYETGLLDADGNASASEFYEKIVQARALGLITDGQPQFAGSSTGDPGLSGVLAELAGDWSVAKTRLGFNNPDRYTTTISMRQEKFRILPGDEGDLLWKDQMNSYLKANILDDPDVRRYCMQVGDVDGSAVPGLVIPFSSTIATGVNFFGLPLAGADLQVSPSRGMWVWILRRRRVARWKILAPHHPTLQIPDLQRRMR